MSSNFFFFFENRVVYEIMWKNTVQTDRPQTTIWRKRTACWIPKATDTQSQHVIPTAFPLQQWLHDRSSILRYTYIACTMSFKVLSPVMKIPQFSGILHRADW
jgi:hypothetical protein